MPPLNITSGNITAKAYGWSVGILGQNYFVGVTSAPSTGTVYVFRNRKIAQAASKNIVLIGDGSFVCGSYTGTGFIQVNPTTFTLVSSNQSNFTPSCDNFSPKNVAYDNACNIWVLGADASATKRNLSNSTLFGKNNFNTNCYFYACNAITYATCSAGNFIGTRAVNVGCCTYYYYPSVVQVNCSGTVVQSGYACSIYATGSCCATMTAIGGDSNSAYLNAAWAHHYVYLTRIQKSGSSWSTVSGVYFGYSGANSVYAKPYKILYNSNNGSLTLVGSYSQNGWPSAFIINMTLSGSSWVKNWAYTMYAGSYFSTFTSCACDSAGNIYAVGYLYGSYFGGYIAKFNSSGTLLWQRYFNFANLSRYNTQVTTQDCLIDSTGTLWVSGYFTDDFNSGSGNTQTFVLKLPTDGSHTGSATVNYPNGATGNNFTYSATFPTGAPSQNTPYNFSFTSTTPGWSYSPITVNNRAFTTGSRSQTYNKTQL